MIIKQWPILYKLSSKNKPQQWRIWVENAGVPYIFVEHGQQGGKLQQTSIVIPEGKNIGRVNETTPQQQALLEAESKWNKQQNRKGYSLSGTSIPKKSVRPMLAKSYDKNGHHISFPCYGQPKLDGIRCLASEKGLFSRQQKEFTSLKHITIALEPIFKKYPELVLDGELYIHGEEFQQLTSAIKRDRANKDSEKVEYHIYDIASNDNYEDRYLMLKKILIEFNHSKLKMVETFLINNKNDIVSYHQIYTNDAYEGIMIRNKKGVYKIDSRSKDLQKYKVFIDEEFKIIGTEPCKGKMEGMCVFVLETKQGTRFKCMPEGTEQYRKLLYKDWKNGNIKKGHKMTVKFFSWSTSQRPVPRFPIGRFDFSKQRNT